MKFIKNTVCMLTVMMLLFILSGCVNATYSLTLKNNGELDVDYKILYNSKGEKEIEESIFKNLERSFADIGYTINEVTDLGMNGFQIIKHNIPQVGDGFADKLPYNVDLLDDIMYNMEFDEEARCNTYDIEANIDLTSFSNVPQIVEQKYTQAEYKKLLSDMNMKLIITLEDGEIVKSNSKNVSADKKTAEWILIPGNTNPVELEAVMGVNRGWKVSMVVVAVILFSMIMFSITLIKMYKNRIVND